MHDEPPAEMPGVFLWAPDVDALRRARKSRARAEPVFRRSGKTSEECQDREGEGLERIVFALRPQLASGDLYLGSKPGQAELTGDVPDADRSPLNVDLGKTATRRALNFAARVVSRPKYVVKRNDLVGF